MLFYLLLPYSRTLHYLHLLPWHCCLYFLPCCLCMLQLASTRIALLILLHTRQSLLLVLAKLFYLLSLIFVTYYQLSAAASPVCIIVIAILSFISLTAFCSIRSYYASITYCLCSSIAMIIIGKKKKKKKVRCAYLHSSFSSNYYIPAYLQKVLICTVLICTVTVLT